MTANRDELTGQDFDEMEVEDLEEDEYESFDCHRVISTSRAEAEKWLRDAREVLTPAAEKLGAK
jgi:hypothetical protein